MLVDISRRYGDLILDAISVVNKRDPRVRRIKQGCYEIGHFSIDMVVWGRNAPHMEMGYPTFNSSSGKC